METVQVHSADLDVALVVDNTAKLTVRNQGKPISWQTAHANKGERKINKNQTSKENKRELMWYYWSM